ncbi:MAG: methylated-DNA--[protein]-cysteine S-methyltransferase [Eubacteriales bacterium]|jgi:AraC family transcriptional regulator of adaptative response/methylated-DNA-[protein]-cysteine methyltransferase
MMKDDEMWEAVRDCDAACDGKFYYGVKTTGIYCRPSCKSKLPKRENVVFFRTREEAEKAGFRPCKRCRQDLLQYDPALELSERTKELVDQHFSDRLKLGRDMKGMGVSRKHLTQIFKQQYDITPSEYLMQVRIAAARKLLQDGADIPDAAGMARYENLSEFYDHFRRQTGMTPARYRQIFADNISRSVLDTPIGPLKIIASQDAVLCVEQTGRESLDAGAQAGQIPADRILSGDASGELVKDCKAQLGEYFAGRRRTFDLPLSPEGTDFQKNVWRHLRDIPYGETRTYGELAEMAGNRKAYRAVGMANHCNPILILVPCHRVIGANGSLTGYAAGIEAKKFLLALEKRVAA